MRHQDPALPALFTREQARRAGMSDDQITTRLSRGRWTAVRRGVLHAGTLPQQPLRDDLDLQAAVLSTGRDVVVGHAHAARLWRLPTPVGGCGEPVLLTTTGPHRHRNGTRVVVTPLPDADVVRHPGGLLVTSLRRTAADCLRVLRPFDGLAVADAASRRLAPGSFEPRDLAAYAGWPGVRGARRLVALVDGRRESAFESWSAWAFDVHGVPPPDIWQADVHDRAGFVGRADAWWEAGLVGEADGRSKYRLRAAERGGVDAERLARILDEERTRETRMRRAGLSVVRWGPSDVLTPRKAADLADFLRTTLHARATAPPPAARVRPARVRPAHVRPAPLGHPS